MNHLALAMPQLLWLLLTLSPVIVSYLSQPLAAASASPVVSPPALAPAPWSLPGCPGKCGNISIPYPFGIGAECSWPGEGNFIVRCNDSLSPPKPYVGDNVEIKNISVESGEMHVFTPVAYRCCNSSTEGTIDWEVDTPFQISPTKNVFTAIGCSTVAFLEGTLSAESKYLTGPGQKGYLTGCISYCEDVNAAAKDGEPCTGLGCCQTTSIPAKLTKLNVNWGNNSTCEDSSCSYAFVAAKDWYNFKRQDLEVMAGMESFNSRFGESNVLFVIDWAITKNGSCQVRPQASVESGKPTAHACVSTNSECVNRTQQDGYLCTCSKGYQGNPYIRDGCQDIDECDLKVHHCPSGSTCKNTPGDYECKCNKLLQKGDGKSHKGCQPRLSIPVIAAIAIILAVVLASLSIILLMRRKQKKLFNKNGGKILKSLGITIYTEKDLDNITKRYSKRLGKGQFGHVYEGTTINGSQTQRVAVKRSVAATAQLPWHKMIRREVPQNEQEDDGFVNEITFQFKIRHTNVVQLLGCCLETDIPILVFEFVPNGSLHDLLHGANKTCTLSLLKRLDIAIGSAEALSHMHSHGDYIRVHGDVKPANILLDKEHKPKVSDFGSSKLLKIDSYARFVAADRSYMDPVYYRTDRFTVKSDVYSFGLVLLELITRKRAKYDGNKSLPMDFVKCCKDEGNGRKMYDMDMFLSEDADQTQRYYLECLDRMSALALRCLIIEDVDERPTMAGVVEELKQVKTVALGTDASSEASQKQDVDASSEAKSKVLI